MIRSLAQIVFYKLVYAVHAARMGVSITTIIKHDLYCVKLNQLAFYRRQLLKGIPFHKAKKISYAHVNHNSYRLDKFLLSCQLPMFGLNVSENTMRQMVADWVTTMVIDLPKKYKLLSNPFSNRFYNKQDLGVDIEQFVIMLSPLQKVSLCGCNVELSSRQVMLNLLHSHGVISREYFDLLKLRYVRF